MILVTGATGNVGRQVVEQLVGAGEKVRAISRNPERAGLPDGVEVVHGDLSRPETLPAALRGVDRAFLFPVFGQLGGFLDVASSLVVIPVGLFEQKPDRIELAMTAAEVEDAFQAAVAMNAWRPRGS